MPDIVELHTSSEFAQKWVEYGLLDAEITFLLFNTFAIMLKEMPVGLFGLNSAFDLYEQYWLPFGECLTDIERTGIRVNKEHLLVK